MAKYCLLFALCLMMADAFGQENARVEMKLSKAVYFTNDHNANCHRADENTSHWQKMQLVNLAEWQFYCLRIPVEISPEGSLINGLPANNMLSIVMLASAEVYWDGQLVGYKGKPGINKTHEVVGPIAVNLPLTPSQLSAGQHLLSLKVSTFHHLQDMYTIFYGIYLNDVVKASKSTQYYLITPMMLCGAMLLLVVYFQFLYWRYSRNPTYFVFSLLALFSGLLIVLEMMKFLWIYPWDFHILRLRIIIAVVAITAVLMVLFYLFYYRLFPRKKWQFFAFSILVASIYFAPSYDFKSLAAFSWAMLLSVTINGFALYRKQANALINTLVLTLGIVIIVIVPFSFVDRWFAALFALIALANIYSLMSVFAQERQKALVSLKLEAEMLRRNIQPHFLMNSLLLVVEWVEQQPKLAVNFINDLASEFALLNTMSKQEFVSWSEESKLCQLHFSIMKSRYQKQIELLIENNVDDFLLPPALIHTLIENAFSHNKINQKDSFLLTANQQQSKIVIELITPYRRRKHSGSGTGEDYIKSRLQLCYDNNWSFQSTNIDNQWHTQIEFPMQTTTVNQVKSS